MSHLNPNWINDCRTELYQKQEGDKFERTISYGKAKQALIMLLSSMNLPFKVYNLGAGVSTITTDTKTCPCCRKLL